MLLSTFRFCCCVDFEECFDIWLANTAEEHLIYGEKKLLIVLCTMLLKFANSFSVCFNLYKPL